MKGLIEVPSPHEIQDAPEGAILGVLDHALQVAGLSLSVQHPPIGRVSECYEGRVPPRDVLLAQLIVDRCTELSELICWYRRIGPRAMSGHRVFDEDRDEQELF